MSTLDVATLRAAFPALASGIAHFDGPGGTQTPAVVGEAIAATITGPLSNRGRGALSERRADEAVQSFRAAYADLLGVPADGIVHGRSATQLTYDVSRALAKTWRPGDNVVVSRLDHDANVRPWVQAAQARDIEVRWLELDPETAELDLGPVGGSLGTSIDDRTRLVAVTGASNLLGTIPPVRAIADRAHAVGALVYVDGVHRTAHDLPDVPALGADLFVCSPYKFFGPHCGVLGADPAVLDAIHPDKLVPSTDRIPERFELGTLPYETLAGATAAVDFLADLPGVDPATGTRRERLAVTHEAVAAHELELRERLEAGLSGFGDRIVLHSRARDRTPTLFVTFPGRRSTDVSQALLASDVLAPADSFYAIEPFRALGLDDDAGLRVGVAAYTSANEVDRLLAGLATILDSAP